MWIPVAIIREENERIGEEGCERVIGLLKGRGYKVVINSIPSELTRRELYKDVTRLLLRCTGTKFDLIARKGDEVIMVDIKTKTSLRHLGWINVEDYEYYAKFNEVIPFVVFFYIKEGGKIYKHKLNPKFASKYPREKAPDGREVLIIPKDEMEEIKGD